MASRGAVLEELFDDLSSTLAQLKQSVFARERESEAALASSLQTLQRRITVGLSALESEQREKKTGPLLPLLSSTETQPTSPTRTPALSPTPLQTQRETRRIRAQPLHHTLTSSATASALVEDIARAAHATETPFGTLPRFGALMGWLSTALLSSFARWSDTHWSSNTSIFPHTQSTQNTHTGTLDGHAFLPSLGVREKKQDSLSPPLGLFTNPPIPPPPSPTELSHTPTSSLYPPLSTRTPFRSSYAPETRTHTQSESEERSKENTADTRRSETRPPGIFPGNMTYAEAAASAVANAKKQTKQSTSASSPSLLKTNTFTDRHTFSTAYTERSTRESQNEKRSGEKSSRKSTRSEGESHREDDTETTSTYEDTQGRQPTSPSLQPSALSSHSGSYGNTPLYSRSNPPPPGATFEGFLLSNISQEYRRAFIVSRYFSTNVFLDLARVKKSQQNMLVTGQPCMMTVEPTPASSSVDFRVVDIDFKTSTKTKHNIRATTRGLCAYYTQNRYCKHQDKCDFAHISP